MFIKVSFNFSEAFWLKNHIFDCFLINEGENWKLFENNFKVLIFPEMVLLELEYYNVPSFF